jgi:hypothetical protein
MRSETFSRASRGLETSLLPYVRVTGSVLFAKRRFEGSVSHLNYGGLETFTRLARSRSGVADPTSQLVLLHCICLLLVEVVHLLACSLIIAGTRLGKQALPPKSFCARGTSPTPGLQPPIGKDFSHSASQPNLMPVCALMRCS